MCARQQDLSSSSCYRRKSREDKPLLAACRARSDASGDKPTTATQLTTAESSRHQHAYTFIVVYSRSFAVSVFVVAVAADADSAHPRLPRPPVSFPLSPPRTGSSDAAVCLLDEVPDVLAPERGERRGLNVHVLSNTGCCNSRRSGILHFGCTLGRERQKDRRNVDEDGHNIEGPSPRHAWLVGNFVRDGR